MFRGRLSERGIERGLADFDASRSFANRKSLGDKRLLALELFVSHDGSASAPATASHRCIDAGAGSFADGVALELSERAENVKDEPSARRRGVDHFCQRAEADAARFQAVYRLDQVRQRAAEPIELSAAFSPGRSALAPDALSSNTRAQAPAVRGYGVCRMHGAGGGAPRTSTFSLGRSRRPAAT